MKSPKLSYLMERVIAGSTLAVGREESQFWRANPVGVTFMEDLKDFMAIDVKFRVVMLGEVLQRVEDAKPVLEHAMAIAERIVVIVPNEHSWLPEYQPLSNKEHKRFYDAEMLCNDLENAGLKYVVNVLDYDGWSFLTADAVKA